MGLTKFSPRHIDNGLVLRLLFTLCTMSLIMISADAFAAASADPIGDALCKMIKIFSGNTARGIAIVGVIVLGIQTLRGQLKWEVALVIVAGIIILFQAPAIITMVGGGEDTCTSITS